MVHIIKDHDQTIVYFLYLKHLKKYSLMTVYLLNFTIHAAILLKVCPLSKDWDKAARNSDIVPLSWWPWYYSSIDVETWFNCK